MDVESVTLYDDRFRLMIATTDKQISLLSRESDLKPDTRSEPDAEESGIQQPRRKGKSRVLLNFWLDALLLANVVVIGWVSAILHIVFPAPTNADGWILWGLTYDQWRDIQSTALCVCALLALEHLVLHWNWVCCTLATRILRAKTRPDEGVQALYGVGTFIGIMAFIFGSVVIAMMCVKQPG